MRFKKLELDDIIDRDTVWVFMYDPQPNYITEGVFTYEV
jgi:hypothetical protein